MIKGDKFIMMSRSLKIALLFLFCVGLMCCTLKQPLPNIVLIFIDDQGYADLGSYGATEFSTPNIDRLAKQGMRFTNFYISQAVCSASRASLLTGCYAERVGISGALNPWAQNGLDPEEETIAELLREKGYKTGIFGKWHLGHEKEFLPLQQGFDEYLGLPYSNDMWPVGYDGKPVRDQRKAYYPQLPLISNNKKIEEIRTLDDQSTLIKRYTDASIKFINKNKSSPFFLYLAHTMVHVPIAASKDFIGTSKQGMYGDVMEEIDWSVGQVMKTLTDIGIAENTLVIYTSDNGPWLNYGNHAGSALPLREGKGTAFEGGVRVPCIMRWPGKIPEKSECNKIVASIDILPTLCTITDSKLPEKKIDGVDVSSLLYNVKKANPRDNFYYYYGGELRAVRSGKWKLYFPHESISYQKVEPGNDGYPGPYGKLIVGLELYDLQADISEKNDVAVRYPKIVEKLEDMAVSMRESLGDRLTGIKGKEIRKAALVGSEKRNVAHLAVGTKIKLKNPYHRRYHAGGEKGLIDGIRGTKDFRDGLWQGFEEQDMIATVDLGGLKEIKNISCGFLQSQGDWIFLPTAVIFEVSADGTKYSTIKSFESKKSEFDLYPNVSEFSVSFEPLQARFVKITARNIKYCPEWHQGAGGRAWVFSDEIIVN